MSPSGLERRRFLRSVFGILCLLVQLHPTKSFHHSVLSSHPVDFRLSLGCDDVNRCASKKMVRPLYKIGSSIAYYPKDDNSKNSASNEPILRMPIQIFIVMACYILHLTQFTQKQIVFPIQLIPNSMCHFTGIGLDSLAGVVSMALYAVVRWQKRRADDDVSPSSNSNNTPWRLPEGSIRNRLTGLLALFLLVQTYFITGRFSLFWEDLLYSMSGAGFPITAPMYRSLVVLLGHLTWLTAGTLILRWVPRPPKFFGSNSTESASTRAEQGDNHFQWFRSNRKSNWLWWVIGGYFVSGCLFNLADLSNQYILPQSVLEDAQESVVSQLVNPEHNDVAASVVGYIAPCLTAPWWEEVLYRGFALPFLTKLVGYNWAVFLQGVIFSAHHMSVTAALPLAVLGWIWAIIYTKSQNLLVVIFIHCLWNSRVFFGSWLGL